MSIADNVARVRETIAEAASRSGRDAASVRLVAATKTQDSGRVREAILAGVDACGENRVQELVSKNAEGAYEGAPIHFIGHLQRNKLNKVVGVAGLIESVDSLELVRLISRRADALGIVQDILLEVNIAREASKTGMDPELLPRFLDELDKLSGVRLRGLMSIAPIEPGNKPPRHYFDLTYKLYIDISGKKYNNSVMDCLSMGMSADYAEAVEAGANIVRVGSAIFGARINLTLQQN